MTEPNKDRTWYAIRMRAREDDAAEEEEPNRPGYQEDDEGEDEGPVAEVLVYDEIGGWGIGAADFDRDLKAAGDVKTIVMRINSPGGDSFAGIAIYNMLKAHPATIKTRVDGIAASAASLIAMAGDQISMPENTFMVVHEPLALTIGPAAAHRAMAEDLDRVAASYAAVYAARSGQTLEAVRSLMAEDRLMSAAECKERGYCDQMRDAIPMRAAWDLSSLPDKHRAMLSGLIDFLPSGGSVVDATGDVTVSPVSPAPAASMPDTATGSPETDTPALQVNPPPEPPAPAQPEPPAPEPPPPASYGQAEITATIELCALAGVPTSTAQKFIAARTPIEKVRTALLEAKAAAADAAVIVPLLTNEGGGSGGMTSEEIVAGKRRLQAIIKRAEKDRIPVEQAAHLVDNHR